MLVETGGGHARREAGSIGERDRGVLDAGEDGGRGGDRGGAGAQPLVEALYSKVLKAGGNPHWMVRSEALQGIMLREGTEEQLKAVSPFDMHLVETADVRIVLWAEVNTKAFGRVEPSRLAMQQAARKPMLKRFMERAATGALRWCGTLYPTAASAQDAEMSLEEYADFVFKGGEAGPGGPGGGVALGARAAGAGARGVAEVQGRAVLCAAARWARRDGSSRGCLAAERVGELRGATRTSRTARCSPGRRARRGM
jgi:hypothetical protein